MTRVLIPADPGKAWGELCGGIPYFLMTPGAIGTEARDLARAFVERERTEVRGTVDSAPAACYELRWVGFDGPDGLGRLCAFARPWQTVDELLALHAPDGLWVQLLTGGEWVQHYVADTRDGDFEDAWWEAEDLRAKKSEGGPS